MRFATLKDGCTCDPGCYPEGCRQYCPVHGDEAARAAAGPDVRITGDAGPQTTVYLFHLLTPAAREWVGEHVELPTFYCDAMVVGHRYVDNLAHGMREAGLTVE